MTTIANCHRQLVFDADVFTVSLIVTSPTSITRPSKVAETVANVAACSSHQFKVAVNQGVLLFCCLATLTLVTLLVMKSNRSNT